MEVPTKPLQLQRGYNETKLLYYLISNGITYHSSGANPLIIELKRIYVPSTSYIYAKINYIENENINFDIIETLEELKNVTLSVIS